MSGYLDAIIPLTLTHTSEKDPAWLGQWVRHLKTTIRHGCKIWPVLEAVDSDFNFMTPLEIEESSRFAVANGADGIVLWHYPLADWQWEEIVLWKAETKRKNK